MNAQDLKNSILQLAIQGKLVEQRPEEGTAKELLVQIEAAKEQLIQDKKIKKQKPLPKITPDEIPFDIPENWEWVRLGYLCDYGKCNSTAAKNIPHDAWLLDLEDIEKNSGKIITKKRMGQVTSTSSKHVFQKGNVLYSKLRPYLNKVVIADEDGYSTSEILPLDFGNYIYNKFAQFALMNPYFIDYTIKCSYGVKMPRLGTNDGQLALFPLPPLVEQKRIVAKIEELMPYIEKYNKAYSEVIELNKKFPADMQKSILQYAIQGKLVEQREEEGTAEELYQQIQDEKKKLIKEGKIKKTKPLPEITQDEIPFEIPENWKWVRLKDIAIYIKAGGDKPKDFSTTKSEVYSVPVIANGVRNDGIIGYTKNATIEDTCITIAGRGTIGFSCLRSEPFTPVVRLIVLKISNIVEQKYVQNVLTALLERGVGTSIKQLTVPMLEPKLIPLPPLEEQKRIVTKIEELLPHTKQLIK